LEQSEVSEIERASNRNWFKSRKSEIKIFFGTRKEKTSEIEIGIPTHLSFKLKKIKKKIFKKIPISIHSIKKTNFSYSM